DNPRAEGAFLLPTLLLASSTNMATAPAKFTFANTLSILGASKWLKANHVTPSSRQSVMEAIARGELNATVLAPRMMRIRIRDLSRYAETRRAR
ncbi:MAG: hypothetical protein JWM95_3938, partial [Gemmatimonadetes bacterium]|nr:hypothetical protein [Gemmatimonadota bacterium]